MRKSAAWGALLLTGVSAGCVAPPPPLPPLVAVPGLGKTDEAFRQDDAACRTVAAEPPPGQPASTAPATAGQANASAETAFTVETLPPGAIYLRCMTARQNQVQPLAPAVPLYAYYQPYPIYAGIGFGDPFFYDYGYPFGFRYGFGFGYGRFGYGRFGYGGRYFGHYGGYGGYRGFGGYRGYGGGFAHGGDGGYGGGFAHAGSATAVSAATARLPVLLA